MLNLLKKKIAQSLRVHNKNSNATGTLTHKELEDLFTACMHGDINSYSLVMEQAKKGDPKAQEIAGRIYFGGHCVSVDYSQATYW